jgi:hypothetical protein
MRWIKLLILSVLIMFLLLTTIAAFLPSQVRISRAIDINQPASKIYPQIAYLKNWENWNLYIQKMDDHHADEDSISGSKLRIRVKGRRANLVSSEWEQLQGKKFTAGFRLIEHSSSTTVQWYFDFRFKWYPWEKFGSIVYDAQIGPVMEKSLGNLKTAIEQIQ